MEVQEPNIIFYNFILFCFILILFFTKQNRRFGEESWVDIIIINREDDGDPAPFQAVCS